MSICFGMNIHILQYFVCASSVRSGVTAEIATQARLSLRWLLVQ